MGEHAGLIRSALANGRRFVSGYGGIDEERVAILERAVEVAGPGDSPERARLLATLAVELSFSGARGRRVELSDEALAVARRLADPRTLSDVLADRAIAIWIPGTLDERLAGAEESVTLADEIGDPLLQFRALHARGVALVQAGRIVEATRDARRQEHLAAELADPVALWTSIYDRASLAMIAGRLEEAERDAELAFEVANGSGQPDGLPVYAGQLANIRYDQGRLPALQPLIAEVVAQNPDIPAFRAVLALAYVEAGLLDSAAELLASDAAGGFAGLPEDLNWLAAHAIYAHVCAEVEDHEAARVLYQRLLPSAGQIVSAGIGAWGDVDHALGRLAAVMGDYDRAQRHLDASSACYERVGSPVWLARAALDTARVLLARAEPANRAAAGELLDRAVREAHRHGATAVERAAAALRDHERSLAMLGPLAPAAASRGRRRGRSTAPAVQGTRASTRERGAALSHHGDLWTLRSPRAEIHLRDSKGVRYLAELLSLPHTDVHVLELQQIAYANAAPPAAVSAAPELTVRSASSDDAGAVLDAQAKHAYRRRIDELRSEVDEAERFNDPERAAKGQLELQALERELAAALGLGGRDRRAASAAERARVNVTRALRSTIRRIAEGDPSLGHHLDRSVRTGTSCAYDPSPQDEISWQLER